MSNWTNNFASVQQPLMMMTGMNNTNIDQLFLKKEEDVNIIKMLELKEKYYLLDGKVVDLLEDEKELESVSNDKNIKRTKEMKVLY